MPVTLALVVVISSYSVRLPAGHGLQKDLAVSPSVSCPGGHAAQSASSSCVLAADVWSNPLYVLTAHAVHLVVPGFGAILPAPHTLHSASDASPVRVEYLPGEHWPAHSLSKESPVCWDHLPAEQLRHCVKWRRPVLLDQRPTGQPAHSLEPRRANVPAGQSVALRLQGLVVPAIE